MRNGAIKLLARLSGREPQCVVPAAMRVLTWLSAESVQHGDAYSFAVTQQVSPPPLLESSVGSESPRRYTLPPLHTYPCGIHCQFSFVTLIA